MIKSMIRFLFGFSVAATAFGYLVSLHLMEVDYLLAAENFGYMVALSFGMMFMKFGFSAFKFWTPDADVKAHLIGQWDRVLGISGWLLMCIGVISALDAPPGQFMSGLSVAAYGLFYSYVLKGFILTAMYPNPDDELYYIQTNHARHSRSEAA